MALIAYVSRVFSDSAGLQLARRFNMEKAVVKDLMWGGLIELMNNKELYYRSVVGPEYGQWSEKGTKVMMEFMNSMTRQMVAAEEKELNRRAKEMVIKGLKGEKV
jgi:hypothetical protein